MPCQRRLQSAVISTYATVAFAGFLLAPPAVDGLSAQPSGAPAEGRRVALTFDDLPMTGGETCDVELVRDVTTKLTGLLEARDIPSAGLASPGRECFDAALLREALGRWAEIGAEIGNHTATHPDLNRTAIPEYLANLDHGQRLIDEAVDTERRWFRPPYLHSGDEPRKKEALARHLAANGYRVAPVTIDNQEWVYAAVYTHAISHDDAALAEQVVDAYVDHLTESMRFYEELSIAVFGREIPQVLLLHANPLNADHLGAVVAMLENRGYRFISLSEAVADPAYERPDTYVGPRGLSWIQRWAFAEGVPVPDEPREAQWVAEAFGRIQAGPASARSAASAGLQDSPREAIAKASRAFSEAYMAGDTATIRELYTTDALLLPPETDVRGRDAIVRYFAPGPRRRNLAHSMTSDELQISDDRAVDVGTWTNTWSIDGGEPRAASGRYLIVWRRGEDGRWRMEYDVWHRPRS